MRKTFLHKRRSRQSLAFILFSSRQKIAKKSWLAIALFEQSAFQNKRRVVVFIKGKRFVVIQLTVKSVLSDCTVIDLFIKVTET
jgi:hypothetical protein